jgi:ribosomal protein L29
MNDKIKIKYKDLLKKSEEELIKMKKQMELHITQAYSPKNIGDKSKGFCLKQERKNIARVNFILKDRK